MKFQKLQRDYVNTDINIDINLCGDTFISVWVKHVEIMKNFCIHNDLSTEDINNKLIEINNYINSIKNG